MNINFEQTIVSFLKLKEKKLLLGLVWKPVSPPGYWPFSTGLATRAFGSLIDRDLRHGPADFPRGNKPALQRPGSGPRLDSTLPCIARLDSPVVHIASAAISSAPWLLRIASAALSSTTSASDLGEQ